MARWRVTGTTASILAAASLSLSPLSAQPASAASAPTIITIHWGQAGDVAVAADYDGDRRTDPAVFRPGTGVWYVRGIRTTPFGQTGDVPVPADYNRDGTADIAVFRPTTGQWLIRGRTTVPYGQRGDVPVPADYDGDGAAEIAVFRPTTGQWLIRGRTTVPYGQRGDVPVPADYDGDGRADLAVYRPGTALWYVRGLSALKIGSPSGIPLTADYRGDVSLHQTTFDPVTGSWTIRGAPTVALGRPGDVPQSGDFAGDYRADRAVWTPATGDWHIRVEPNLPPLPSCAIRDVPTAHSSLTDWSRSVLDWVFRLPSTYAPTDLRSTSTAGLNAGQSVRNLVIPDLRAMATAAAAAHAPLAAQSAYRSHATQISTFNYYVSVQGYAQAIKASARPGHSEHQLGTTIDFRSSGGRPAWEYADWAATPAGRWMKANAWKYGFVMSYPAGRTSTTCYQYEPWHYRYVGRVKAAKVRASGLTLREYLWRQQVS